MNIEQFFLEGLGHQSYLITDEESGNAAVVDPRRDVEIYMEAAHRAGVRITHILETHVHNDYVTGARELAAQTGATIVASAGDPLHYAHRPVREGEDIQVGTLRFRIMETPGHTPHHVSYALYEQERDEPAALFSGGSLLAGNAGRTDLLGDVWTLTLTRQQYHTLRRLLDTLPGQVRVYPTHGAGSFCMASATTPAHSTTIAQERLISPAVRAVDEVDFVKRQLAGYIAYPTYYKYMHETSSSNSSRRWSLQTGQRRESKWANLSMNPCSCPKSQVRLKEASFDRKGWGDAWTETRAPQTHRGMGEHQTVDVMARARVV